MRGNLWSPMPGILGGGLAESGGPAQPDISRRGTCGGCVAAALCILENVSTVLADKHRDRLARFERILNDGGYVFQKVLVDASDFGLPQKRKRAFFLVSRDPLNAQEISRRLERLKSPWQSTEDAFKGLPTPMVRPDDYNDEGDYAGVPNHFAMCHSQRVIEKIAAIEPGTGPMSYRRLHPSRPSNTLFSGHRTARSLRRTSQYYGARGCKAARIPR